MRLPHSTAISIFLSCITMTSAGAEMTGITPMQKTNKQMQGTQPMPGMQMQGTQSTMLGMPMPGMNMDDGKPASNAPPPLMPAGHLEFNEIPAVPTDSKNYTLQDFEKLAIEHNPTLVQAKAQIDGGKRRK